MSNKATILFLLLFTVFDITESFVGYLFCLVTLKKWDPKIRYSYHFQGSGLIEIIQDA